MTPPSLAEPAQHDGAVPRWFVGLMTGTALDGCIDAALIKTDGAHIAELGPFRLHAYGGALRARLAEAVAAARAWGFDGIEPGAVTAPERAYTEALAEAVRALLVDSGIAPGEVAGVGMHGLTVLHRRPEASGGKTARLGATRQIGDGGLLAQLLGIPVAFDFRTADVAAGGQGAPLAPVYHAALLDRSGLGAETAVLNLGGVANLTWRGADGELAAFDCGPANGPINEWMEAHGRGVMDEGGRTAAGGRVHDLLLEQVLDAPYFSAPYPKSLDRYDFSAACVRGLSLADGAATLTALAAEGVARGLEILPRRPTQVVVCGGGRKNPILMAQIASRAQVRTIDADHLGWRGDAIEAEAFGFLAARTFADLPISFPGATGVPHPLRGGRIAHPDTRG